ncbi:hypothetical protein [Natrialba taiwanensis]|uniref:hypothetical protein n=1 Tax=Natrialba taiwanensis TaxID=160846 RepID=UPI000B2114B0|nr:hypothetical protein [Natrialba taiwanensis]
MTDPRELVEEWRDMADKEGSIGNHGSAVSYEMCADELEEALDETEERRPNAQTYEVTD